MNSNEQIGLDVSIDKHRLDEQWADQPGLRFRYGAELAEARREVSRAKANVDLTAAELDNEIRESPESFGLTKITEAAIKATIPSNKRYRKAQDRLIEAEYSVNILTAAVSAIDHRKKALEDEVALWLGDYFSSPRAPEGAKDRMQEVEKQATRGKGRPKPETGEDEDDW